MLQSKMTAGENEFQLLELQQFKEMQLERIEEM